MDLPASFRTTWGISKKKGAKRLPCAKTKIDWGNLFLERADMGHQRLHFISAQVTEGLHLHLITFLVLDAFFNGLGHFLVFHLLLNAGVGVVFHTQFLAHFGFAFAIFAVALGAILSPNFFGIRCASRKRPRDEQSETKHNYFFHKTVCISSLL